MVGLFLGPFQDHDSRIWGLHPDAHQSAISRNHLPKCYLWAIKGGSRAKVTALFAFVPTPTPKHAPADAPALGPQHLSLSGEGSAAAPEPQYQAILQRSRY